MAGHMILVSFPRPGGEPLRATYAVAGGDMQSAQDILVHALRTDGLDVTYGRAMTDAEIEMLGLTKGQFRSFWPTVELR